MDSKVARDWLDALARTANAKDFAAHMDLISKQVQVFGVPGFEVIGYDDWARQSEHEFSAGILARVSYQGLKVQAMTPGRVMFKTLETLETSDGETQTQGVEIVIVQESDGVWRVTQERVLAPEEAKFDGLYA
jgi:ketosteroid isomerase-like protein